MLGDPVQTKVHRDSKKPGGHLGLGSFPARGMKPDAGKDLLRDFFGFAPITQGALGEGEDTVEVSLDENATGVPIA